MFKLTIEKPNGEQLEYTIDSEEMDYMLQQIKFNQPFVIVTEDNIVAYSPSQLLSIKIQEIVA